MFQHEEIISEGEHIHSDDIEDDAVIILEGDNDDNFSLNMLKYFEETEEKQEKEI